LSFRISYFLIRNRAEGELGAANHKSKIRNLNDKLDLAKESQSLKITTSAYHKVALFSCRLIKIISCLLDNAAKHISKNLKS
jgi:hypothetical protein